MENKLQMEPSTYNILLPIEMISLILPYLDIMSVGCMDMAFTNRNDRKTFKCYLKEQETLVIKANLFLFDKHSFIRWLILRDMNYSRIILINPTTFLFNSIVCIFKEKITELEVTMGRVSKESMGIMSLLCPNIKLLKYQTISQSLLQPDDINNEDMVDSFYDIQPKFLNNLEYLHLSNCSNYAVLLLTLYATKLKYLKIDNIRIINSGILHDFVVLKHDSCYIDCDLIWSVKTNLFLMRQRNYDCHKIINIELNYDDMYFLHKAMMKELFFVHKKINKMVIRNVIDVENCNTVFESINEVAILSLHGTNVMHLSNILDVIEKKKISIFKLSYVPTIVDHFFNTMISFFQCILSKEGLILNQFELVIDLTINLVDDNISFEKYVEFIGYLEAILKQKKINIFKFNYQIVKLNTNWKNNIYYYFMC